MYLFSESQIRQLVINEAAVTKEAKLHEPANEEIFASYFGIKERGKESTTYLSGKDLLFWRSNPPQEIIIASSSMRRGLMAAYLMTGLAFPALGNEMSTAQTATDLQDYFNELIPNGDGRFENDTKIILGYFHGVPLYIEKQDGETTSNDHMEQARNKAEFMFDRYQGKDVLIVAVDTVDSPITATEQLGKPYKMREYAQFDPIEHDGISADEWYLRTFFPTGTRNNHRNGVAVIRSSEPREQIVLQEFALSLEVTPDIFQQLKVLADCGGGGICQQLINWASPESVSSSLPDDMSKKVGDLPHEVKMWTLYCHITGMPWWAIEDMITQHYGKIEIVD